MAKAITNIERIQLTEEQKRKKDLEEIETALLNNKDAILETMDILKHLNQRGVLSLLSGLFSEGDKVLNVLVKAADKPEATNTIKNLLLMVGVLGTINVQQLEPLLIKLNSGIARVSKYTDSEDDDKLGYFDIVRSLKDPEINRALSLLFEFLKGMGEDTKGLERTTQLPEDQDIHQNRNGTLVDK
jgi:uncharacterized protein YjgD (DUF1641 family)